MKYLPNKIYLLLLSWLACIAHISFAKELTSINKVIDVNVNAGLIKSFGGEQQYKELSAQGDVQGCEVTIHLVAPSINHKFYTDYLRNEYHLIKPLYINVPETQFSFVLKKGEVTNLILDEQSLELWKLSGMIDRFGPIDKVYTKQKSIIFVKRGSEQNEIWEFVFSSQKECKISLYYNIRSSVMPIKFTTVP